MQNLQLDLSTEAYLTDRVTGQLVLDGNGNAQQLAQDLISGKYYKKVADVLPSESDPQSKARKAAILDQNPITARNARGYWVELPGYSPLLSEAELAQAKAAAAK